MGLSIWEGNKAKDATEALQTIAEMQKLKAQYHGLVPINNWNVIGSIIREGKGPTLLPVGYQITDEWIPSNGGTALNAVWDVVNHDEDGMELNWHYTFPNTIQFDAPEAIYYAPSGGLAAGQYYITISMNYGTGWVAGHHINFTLTSAMAEGDQLFIDCGTNYANNPTAGRAWNVYAKGSTTSKQSGTTSDSDTGTELGATYATKTSLPNGNINAPQRVVYGYNRWSQSNIRQYLNATGAGGTWWTAQNPWDRPAAQAATVRGWLGGCSDDFINNIATSDVVTYLTTDDAEAESKNTETTYDKIYLPCLENWYINTQLADEGNEWDYYKELAAQAGLPGKFLTGQIYPILSKYDLAAPTSSAFVWLRSCNRGYAGYSWFVNNLGYVYGGNSGYYYAAYSAFRGCPACKISKST